MFFILSKILSFLVTPIVWIALLMLLSFIIRDDKKKRKFLLASVICFFVFSNPFIFDTAMRAWEIPATPNEQLGTYDAGIVLGGVMCYDRVLDRVQFLRGNDRLMQAIELYRRGVIKKIFFVGGSGSLTESDIKEGFFIARFLKLLQIPEEDMIIESESNNTYQNALFAKQMLEHRSNPDSRGNILLITSGFHMRRSLACFNKTGIHVTSYSTDRYCGPMKYNLDYLLVPNSGALSGWEELFHELIGYGMYSTMGYL